ncbi:hypothetical protein QFC21_000279 [Naganishia friedmannii]|uniref:Uncharacterized protein n=1 Tax=Naganishia friedmannii TaxID=89922 RepID=A0ACC2WDL6_9TREE|nr:hypothetical protein QFC21_000279 [Naganishia friedmannii]
MKSTLVLKTLLCAAAYFGTAQATFDCRPSFDLKDRKGETTVHFDLESLSGLRTASKQTETPPTTNEATVSMTLCGDDVLPVDDKIAEEDQCPPNTKVCLVLLNHKSSSTEASRITAVIPIWMLDTPDSDVSVAPRSREEGLDITVSGPDYAGTRQQLELNLICGNDAASTPELVSYSDGKLVVQWETPSGCESALEGGSDKTPDGEDSGGSPRGGRGFFHYVFLTFWLSVIGLFFYFAVGIWYNYTTYGARGLDLLPHKEFWRDLPTFCSDLAAHVTSSIRGSSGGGSRGGYTAI